MCGPWLCRKYPVPRIAYRTASPPEPMSIKGRRPRRSTTAIATKVKTRLTTPVITMLNITSLTP